MRKMRQPVAFSATMLFLLAVVISCASVPELKINYRLPTKSDALEGRQVFLSFADLRTKREILGARAQKDFKNFAGNISLFLARGQEEGSKIGVFDVPSLFLAAFGRRLENLGVQVVPQKDKAAIEMVIALEDFLLDLVGRKWVVTMGYEVRLLKDGTVSAKQRISGQAERAKVLGKGQAHTVMGEIFTDMVNGLDLAKLFQEAKL